MFLRDLDAQVAEKLGVNDKDAVFIVRTVLREIVRGIAKDGVASFRGLGRWEVSEPRKHRYYHLGKGTTEESFYRRLKFKPCAALREWLRRPEESDLESRLDSE